MDLATLILAAVTLERIAELPVARANTRRLLAAGGHEVAAGHYPLIIAVHVAWLGVLWAIGPGRPVSLPLLALFGLVEGLRFWTLASLGRRWTTRIIVVPGERLVTRGPYKYLDHPNYWIVVAEIALVPALLGLYWVAVLFSLVNALALNIRIRAEREALAPYRQGACDSVPTGL